MKKRIVYLLLTISMLITFPCISLATSNLPESWDDACSEQLFEQIGMILSDSTDPLNGKLDAENIQIGESIKLYEIIGTEAIELDFTLFPVFSNGKLVMFANKVYDGNGNYNIQITRARASEISEFYGERISLVYDAENCYVLINGVVRACYGFADEIQYRSCLSLKIGDIIEDLNIEYVKLDAQYHLDYAPVAPIAITTVIRSVPVVLQPTNYICWAATVASIGKYLTGISMTAEEVAISFTGNTTTSVAVYDALLALLIEFGVSYLQYDLSVAPSQNQIYRNLANNYPMYGRFHSGGSVGHAVVIRGIASNGTLYIMDPLYGYDYAYYSNGVYSYTSAASGTKFTLIGYGAKLA